MLTELDVGLYFSKVKFLNGCCW